MTLCFIMPKPCTMKTPMFGSNKALSFVADSATLLEAPGSLATYLLPTYQIPVLSLQLSLDIA